MTPVRYLAIETSSPRLSLAVGNDIKILSTYTGTQDWRHAEQLFQGIKTLLSRVRWKIQSVTGVSVSRGPGSFTGIRIGLAAARALGQSLQVPVVGFSSLEILAAGAKTQAEWLAPQVDALRGQIFSSLFRRNGDGAPHRVLEETMVHTQEWTQRVKRHVGRAAVWISPLKGCYPEAKVLLALARPTLAKARSDSYKSVLPLYIRRSSAEERLR
jgi:tRNA threonylcarbamoyladenosine biosynthesis protein TsaB